ncbi:MAG: AsmA-like C-terminal region-containing protein [Hyphomicrobiaceae bacterium]
MRTAGGGRRQLPRTPRVQREVPSWEEGAAPTTRGQRALRHAGRGARFVIFALVPFVVLFALAAALTFVRLRHGPISLSFLVPPIERSLNAVLKGYVASVDDAIVRLTDDNRLEFRLQNIRFAEADGDTVASSPLASLEISRQALLQGMVVPSRVELIEPQLFLTYAPDKGVGLSFSALQDQPGNGVAPGQAKPDNAAVGVESGDETAPGGAGALKSLNFSDVIRRATSEARGAGKAASYLREFGVRDAILNVEAQGNRTTWQLPELNIDFDHRESHSVVSGRARVASPSGSWRLAFHTDDSAGETVLRASIRDFVPAAFFDTGHGGSLLGYIDLPIGADVILSMEPQGSVRAAHVDFGLGQGKLAIRDRAGRLEPIPVSAGRIKLNYDPATGAVDLQPSTLQAAGSTVTFTGKAHGGTFDGDQGWAFELGSIEGTMGSGEFAAPPVPLESLVLQGRFLPARQLMQLSKGELRAGGAVIAMEGEASLDNHRPGVRFAASTGPMQAATAKALWPVGLTPKSRIWVGEHVMSGELRRLEFRRETGIYAPANPSGSGSGRVSLSVETGQGTFKPTLQLPPINVPRVLVTLENEQLDISVPEGAMTLESGKTVNLKAGRLVSNNILAEPSDAVVSFKAQSDAMTVVELLGRAPISLIAEGELPFKSMDGRVEAQMSLAFPMKKELTASQIKTTGAAKLKDGRIQKLLGEYDVQGASVAFDFNNGAVEAKGEAIVRGVLARISWQHIFEASPERQPPLRITATLDNTDRRQLGIDLSHMVTGEMPVDMQVVQGVAPGERKIHVRADLSSADITLAPIAWRKPPGRTAFAEFDIAAVAQNKYELQNFRIAGDNVAIEGWASIGADRKLREFYFPDFSLNVVTRLKVQGVLRNDNVWDVKARGTTFDGKDYFRSLFTVGRGGGAVDKADSGGVDLDAQIDNVLGFADASLRGLKVQLKTREGRLSALDARGTLDGGAPLAVLLDVDGHGQRRIRADSTDAGQAFKLVGFYPNMQNGRVRLELNVDGSGAAEKSGTLWVEDFRVLGDPVVSEVVSSGLDDGRPSIGGKKRIVREVFEFDTMRVPFSLGHGQFVLDDAYMRGPLLGATIRGKVDYKTERVNLGGTYIPLQGLNNAFGQIPVLGQILSGPRGEGLFGITFAITGAMTNPQVIVNPLSLVAPGIFREVFQMTNPSTKVQPRKPEPASKRGKGRQDPGATSPGTTIDGWSSDTKTP